MKNKGNQLHSNSGSYTPALSLLGGLNKPHGLLSSYTKSAMGMIKEALKLESSATGIDGSEGDVLSHPFIL